MPEGSGEPVRVWKPPDITSLVPELVSVQNSPVPHAKQLVGSYYFSVRLTSGAVFEYRGSRVVKGSGTLNLFSPDDVITSHPQGVWDYKAFRLEAEGVRALMHDLTGRSRRLSPRAGWSRCFWRRTARGAGSS